MRLHRLRFDVTCIITSSLNSLLPTRALCGCMDNNPLVLKTRSTGAVVVAEIQQIFSNSPCTSANSFFYLTRSQSSLSSSSRLRCIVLVIIILCLQNAESSKISRSLKIWGRGRSSMTRTSLEDNNTVIVTLPLSLWPVTYCVSLSDIWRNVYFLADRPYCNVFTHNIWIYYSKNTCWQSFRSRDV